MIVLLSHYSSKKLQCNVNVIPVVYMEVYFRVGAVNSVYTLEYCSLYLMVKCFCMYYFIELVYNNAASTSTIVVQLLD